MLPRVIHGDDSDEKANPTLEKIFIDPVVSYNVKLMVTDWYSTPRASKLWGYQHKSDEWLEDLTKHYPLSDRESTDAFLKNENLLTAKGVYGVPVFSSIFYGTGARLYRGGKEMPSGEKDYFCEQLLERKLMTFDVAYWITKNKRGANRYNANAWMPTAILEWIRKEYGLEAYPDNFVYEFLGHPDPTAEWKKV